jgi:hypothetical protein
MSDLVSSSFWRRVTISRSRTWPRFWNVIGKANGYNREANKPTTYVKSPSIVLSNKAQPKSVGKQSGEQAKRLEELGVSVFMPDGKAADIDWNYLAGYEQQKRDIEDTVLLALTHPDVYDSITKLTRVK